MKKIGSEYHKQLGTYEKKVFGSLTLRQLVFIFLVFMVASLLSLINLINLFSYIAYSFLLLLLIPIVLIGLNKEEFIIEEVKFFLSIKQFYYTTDIEREVFVKNDFQKPVQEWENDKN